jgi:hypothetical protein
VSDNTTPRDEVGRKGLCKDFDKLTADINAADQVTQVAIGHGLNLVHSIFRKSYCDLADYKALPKSEKIEYLNRMSRFEEELLEQNNRETAIGCALFKMWLGAIAEGDDELAGYFSNQLEQLSRLGDLLNTDPS